jgi:DNA polymerase-3 subunit delta
LGATTELAQGRPADAVAEAWRGLHFKRKPLIKKQLQRWTSTEIKAAVGLLQEAMLRTRRQSDLDHAIAGRALLEISRAARRGRKSS